MENILIQPLAMKNFAAVAQCSLSDTKHSMAANLEAILSIVTNENLL